MEMGGDVKGVFSRLARGIKAVEDSVRKESGRLELLWQEYLSTYAVRAERSSIEDLVLMRTKLLNWSSFSPHLTQKVSFSLFPHA